MHYLHECYSFSFQMPCSHPWQFSGFPDLPPPFLSIHVMSMLDETGFVPVPVGRFSLSLESLIASEWMPY